MKYLVIALLLIGIISHSKAQTEKLVTTPASLMEKSDQQNTAGWILLGSGTALLVTSWVIPSSYDYTDGTSNQTVISVLRWAGAISIAVSIPIFLSSGSNARTAAKLGLQNQAINQPIPLGPHSGNIPSLSLKILL